MDAEPLRQISRALSLGSAWVDARFSSRCGYGTFVHPVYPCSTLKGVLQMLLALRVMSRSLSAPSRLFIERWLSVGRRRRDMAASMISALASS